MSAVGGLLDRYVGRRFVGLYGLCVLGFVLLFLVVDGVGRIDDFIDARESLAPGESITALAIEYYVSKIPVFSVLFAPYLTLFAAIACLMTLTRHNELSAMISCGRSLHRVLLPVYVASLVITAFLLVAEQQVVPASLRRIESVERRLEHDKSSRGEQPPHLRDAINTLVAERWVPRDLRLVGVSSIGFRDPEGRLPEGKLTAEALVYRRRAADGRLGWFPIGGTLTPAGKDATGRLADPVPLPRDEPLLFLLTPTEIDILVESEVAALSSAKIRELRRLYADKPDQVAQLSLQLHSRNARPFANLVLLLLGLPFVARPGQRSIAAGLAVAFGCCVVYMTGDLIAQELGSRQAVGPLTAAWLAPLVFGAVALARLDRAVT